MFYSLAEVLHLKLAMLKLHVSNLHQDCILYVSSCVVYLQNAAVTLYHTSIIVLSKN